MEKNEQIAEIKRIIAEWGCTTACELELDSSPCISSIGNYGSNVSQLVENFNPEYVTAVTYLGENEIGEIDLGYEDLSEDIIDEIYNIMEQYDLTQIKLYDNIKDEDF
jgi:hypothetical protein